MKQTRTPNPNIPCKPGWCLQYVRQTYGLPAKYPSATANWNASETQHHDTNFPPDVWLPLWFHMPTEPLGHVVLRAPDGSIYSTSDNSTIPHHHPNLADLIRYYAYYKMPLNYLGWTEDIEGYPVVEPIPVPLATTGETKMLAIARTHDDPAVWIGDGIQRRHITDEQTLTDYQWGAANGRFNIYKGGEVQYFNSVESLGQPV